MSACVSPPHESVSHKVAVAAIIAHAASTALPPFWKTIAPAVAPRGFPVIAIQWRPCSGGFCVRCAREGRGAVVADSSANSRTMKRHFFRRIAPSVSSPENLRTASKRILLLLRDPRNLQNRQPPERGEDA